MAIRWVPLYSGCVTKLCNAVMSNRVTEFFKIGGIDYCISLISLSKTKTKTKPAVTNDIFQGDLHEVSKWLYYHISHTPKFYLIFLIGKAAYPQVNAVNEDIYTTIHKQYGVLHSPVVSCLISTSSLTALFACKYFIPIYILILLLAYSTKKKRKCC